MMVSSETRVLCKFIAVLGPEHAAVAPSCLKLILERFTCWGWRVSFGSQWVSLAYLASVLCLENSPASVVWLCGCDQEPRVYGLGLCCHWHSGLAL